MRPDDTVPDGKEAVGRIPTSAEVPRRVGRQWHSRVTASLAIPHFRILLLGSTGSFFAMQMLFVAQAYLAYTIGNSALSLGAVNLAWGLPLIPLSLVGGATADRLDKRSLMISMQTLLGTAALVTAILIAADLIELWHLIIVGIVQGVAFSFNMPARQAIIPELVDRALLGNAIALNAMATNLARIAGPALAGTLIGATWFGMANTYLVVALVFYLVALTTFKLPRFPSNTAKARESIFSSVATGLGFLRRSPLLLMLIGMAFIPTMFGLPYQALLPVFSSQVLVVGAEELGHLYAASGAGALLGSLAVATLRAPESKTKLPFLLGATFGLGLTLFSLSADYWSAITLLFVIGVVSQGYFTLNNTLIMTNTAREFYGRVMSIYLLTFSVLPLATFPLSALADAIGISATLTISGSTVAIFILGMAVLSAVRGQVH